MEFKIEKEFYCPICGGIHFTMQKMHVKSPQYERCEPDIIRVVQPTSVVIDFYCPDCECTIVKDFGEVSFMDDEPYGLFTPYVKQHIFRRFIGVK